MEKEEQITRKVLCNIAPSAQPIQHEIQKSEVTYDLQLKIIK